MLKKIPPIEDGYIDEVIKSAGPHNPNLNKTQGVLMRELVKLLRDRLEQEIKASYEASMLALKDKVDKEEGKGLSSEDYTAQDKAKLAGLENYDPSPILAQLDNKANISYVDAMVASSYKVRPSVSTVADLPMTGNKEGDVRNVLDTGDNYVWTAELGWDRLSGVVHIPVTSVNTKTGDVVLNKIDVGLSNVDNTSDIAKPVSTAQLAVLNAKLDKVGGVMTGTLQLMKGTPEQAPVVIPMGALRTLPLNGAIERDLDGKLYTTYNNVRYMLYDTSTNLYSTLIKGSLSSSGVNLKSNISIKKTVLMSGGKENTLIIPKGLIEPAKDYKLFLLPEIKISNKIGEGSIPPVKLIFTVELSIADGKFKTGFNGTVLPYINIFKCEISTENFPINNLAAFFETIIRIESPYTYDNKIFYNDITLSAIELKSTKERIETFYPGMYVQTSTTSNGTNLGTMEIKDMSLIITSKIEWIFEDAKNENGQNIEWNPIFLTKGTTLTKIN